MAFIKWLIGPLVSGLIIVTLILVTAAIADRFSRPLVVIMIVAYATLLLAMQTREKH